MTDIPSVHFIICLHNDDKLCDKIKNQIKRRVRDKGVACAASVFDEDPANYQEVTHQHIRDTLDTNPDAKIILINETNMFGKDGLAQLVRLKEAGITPDMAAVCSYSLTLDGFNTDIAWSRLDAQRVTHISMGDRVDGDMGAFMDKVVRDLHLAPERNTLSVLTAPDATP